EHTVAVTLFPRDCSPLLVHHSAGRYYRQRLTRNMDILTHGLEQIAHNYARHITLTEEDPETFGAGHYVLYPHGRTDRRFTVEERYIDTDWSDPDRLPASWTWKAQTRHQRSDGSHRVC
ncbi:hypothetical protein SD455_16670, partial [Nesterenkonia sp. K-15-9-6]